jgi:acyl-coenzyme A synthetase/AMP-(fatty) acid ligase
VLLGRTGKVVKIGARRINLGEVEAALRALPGVREVYVTLHPTRPDSLAAAVAGRAESGAMRDSLQSRLAGWKIPDRLVVLDEFPVTARGKTDTRQLRQVLAGAGTRAAPPVQGSTPKSK